MTVQGQEVVLRQSETIYLKWTPRQKRANYWLVDYEIVGIKIDVRAGGNMIVFDSFDKNPAAKNASIDFYKTLLNAKLSLKVIKHPIDGIKVTEVQGVGNLLNRLPPDNPQAKPLLEQRFEKGEFECPIPPDRSLLSPQRGRIQKGKLELFRHFERDAHRQIRIDLYIQAKPHR